MIALAGAVCVSVSIEGCSDSESASPAASFASTPKDCAGLMAAVSQPLAQFAGQLFDSAGTFSKVDISDVPAAPGQETLMCSARYGLETFMSPAANSGQPRLRSVSIRFNVDTSADAEAAITRFFDSSQKSFNGSTTKLTALGSDAYAGTRVSGRVAESVTEFRVGNLAVDVITRGENYVRAGDSEGTSDSPELTTALRSGSEAIARAVNANLTSLMP
ncbi:hypothetical protein [Nocardia huaxiensis]|uniref:Uncharacterized protein n=1 Tax=Nocardia huaxiensis TaxID=2755382 RepID=A0A7D6ZNY1_9NOCA|nr:hypothetical protein [Nocardia huaxiensis]QLY31863.1 hypothetical protein H0264_06020 [Nocardia huaxiensis]UFS95427.1 hypothetical protein LPY97_32890 [Nocardia huaxiensis]